MKDNIYQVILKPVAGCRIDDIAEAAYELNKQLRLSGGVLFHHNDRVYSVELVWRHFSTFALPNASTSLENKR